MKKRLRLLTSHTASAIALLLALAGSQVSWGLGLGDIKVESALNEPLVAKIELLNVSTLSNSDLIVGIGSREDYRIAGVERDFFHTDLTLEAYIDEQGTPYISVTSTKPALEPFVNFVVQVRWPQGKLLREYTVLLDLPVFTGRSQQEKPKAPKAASKPASSPSANQSRALAPKKTAKTSKPAVNTGGEYLVKNGDTLWSLSGDIAEDTGTTRQQAMLAIRDGNPNAFMNGDPNALKAGVVLRMPEQNQVAQRSASDAAVEFANLQKRSGRALEATPVRSSSNNFREQQTGAASSAGRLALTSSAALGAGAGTDSQASEADSNFINENATLKEELDRVEVENNDLRERVSALEEQLELATKLALLEIEDNELAAVSEGLEATKELANEPVVEQDTPVEAPVQQAPETEAVLESQPEPPLQAEIVQAETSASEPSFVESLMGFLPYIGAGILVILLVVMMVLKRRKASSEDDDDLLADELDSEIYDEDDGENLEGEAESAEPEQSELADTAGLTEDVADLGDDEDDFEDGMESMDELFADDGDVESAAEETADEMPTPEADVKDEDIGEIDDGDVEDIDLEGALEDLDEFADLDSFFDSDDIEDFDPDSSEGFDEVEEDSSPDSTDDSGSVEDEFSETVIAGADDLDSSEEPDGETDQDDRDDSNEMDFESFEDESLDDLHDEEHSMDFDDELELPALDETSDEDPLDSPENNANSMEFDLDDFDPIGDTDDANDEVSEPAENEMEFDVENLELPSEVVDEPAEDLHGEEHSMDFDDQIELPEVEDEIPVDEGNAENSMAFDISDLDLPEDDSATADDDLSGLGLDLDADLDDSDDEEDVSDLTGGLEDDMDELLADFDEQEDVGQSSTETVADDFDLSNMDLGNDSDQDESLDLDDDLNLDDGLDLGDDLLADFGDDASGDDLEEEMNTKLELAEAYVEMVDIRGAKELISEILADGNDTQKEAAQKLSERIEGLS